VDPGREAGILLGSERALDGLGAIRESGNLDRGLAAGTFPQQQAQLFHLLAQGIQQRLIPLPSLIAGNVIIANVQAHQHAPLKYEGRTTKYEVGKLLGKSCSFFVFLPSYFPFPRSQHNIPGIERATENRALDTGNRGEGRKLLAPRHAARGDHRQTRG